MTMLSLSIFGQDIDSLQADTVADKAVDLQNVTITSRRSGTRRMGGAVNGVLINREELFKAAKENAQWRYNNYRRLARQQWGVAE